MALPILADLDQDITRLIVAGSPHAVGDPRLKKYIPVLEKLGEKVPVFATLAQRLTVLVEGDEKSSPEALLSVGMLLTSIMYTQGSSDTGALIQELAYGEKPLTLAQIPYSRLREIMRVFEAGGQKQSRLPEKLFAKGNHRDPRLIPSYLKAITDAKSPISHFVCEKILPDIGADALPFLLAEFDAGGRNRHARILGVLRTIMGRDVIPVAEKALAEGSPFVISEALRALAQDEAYEETLIAYTGDRKGEIREAALAGLVVMGSDRGNQMLLDALDKDSYSFLEEALTLSTSPAVVAKIREQAGMFKLVVHKPDGLNSGTVNSDMVKNVARLRILLIVMASRSESVCLKFVEDLLSDKTYYAETRYDLELDKVMQTLCEADLTEKIQMVVRVCSGDESRVHYKLRACGRLFSAEEVYDRCYKELRKTPYASYIYQAYTGDDEVPKSIPDAAKPWDRRWARLFAEECPDQAWFLAYDDDVGTWRKLLAAAATKVKNVPNSHSYYRASYRRVLVEAFRRNHPEAKKYFDEFIKNGVSREELIHVINQAVPGALQNGNEDNDKE